MNRRRAGINGGRSWVAWAAPATFVALVILVVWLGLRWHKYTPSEINKPRSGCGRHCGTERWEVKTLSDEEATCINFTPKQTTVSWLVSQPERSPEQNRSGSIECQVWQLTGQVLKFKAEDDGDFHVVLADLENPGLTMIVEFPDPSCAGVCNSLHQAEMVEARDNFTQVFGSPPKRFKRVMETVTVSVTGVGFFDFKDRQTGLALNGVELHPVIGFEVSHAARP